MIGFEIRTFEDTYTFYELKELSTNSWFQIVPERGGIVVQYGTFGEERLYLDRNSLLDPKANVRGGIPILFPCSGTLTKGEYEWNGVRYNMMPHGFARNQAWTVERTGEDDGVYITLNLQANEETHASYPFDFELRFTYRLLNGRLTIEQEYRNRSGEPMPMYPGFHPYFFADNKAVKYETDATRYFDFNDFQEKDFSGAIDMDTLPQSVAFLNAKEPAIDFHLEGSQHVSLSYSDAFRYVVLWSIQGKPFLCVEPWMALPDEFNKKEKLVYVPAGGLIKSFLTIESRPST